jgi:hypothetical protein
LEEELVHLHPHARLTWKGVGPQDTDAKGEERVAACVVWCGVGNKWEQDRERGTESYWKEDKRRRSNTCRMTSN